MFCSVRSSGCCAVERLLHNSSLSSRISLASMSRRWCQVLVRFADVGVVEQFSR